MFISYDIGLFIDFDDYITYNHMQHVIHINHCDAVHAIHHMVVNADHILPIGIKIACTLAQR